MQDERLTNEEYDDKSIPASSEEKDSANVDDIDDEAGRILSPSGQDSLACQKSALVASRIPTQSISTAILFDASFIAAQPLKAVANVAKIIFLMRILLNDV